jgi:hypothetical protein
VLVLTAIFWLVGAKAAAEPSMARIGAANFIIYSSCLKLKVYG